MECKKTREICNLFTACNARVYPIVANNYAPPGWPDRIIIHNYYYGFIEFKDTKTRVQDNQKKIIADIVERGGLACIARFVPSGIEIDDKYLLHKPVSPQGAAQFLKELGNLLRPPSHMEKLIDKLMAKNCMIRIKNGRTEVYSPAIEECELLSCGEDIFDVLKRAARNY